MVEIVLILAFVIIFFAVMGRDFFQSFPVTAKYNWGFTIFIAALWIVRVTAFFYCAVPVIAGVLRAAYKDAGHGCLDRTVRKSPFRQMDIHTCRQLYSRISAPFHCSHIPAPSLQEFAACAKNQ